MTLLGELSTLLEARPGSTPRAQAAQVRGSARWRPGSSAEASEAGLPPAELLDLAATIDESGGLATLALASDQAALEPFGELVGASALAGFRRRLSAISDRTEGSLLAYRLLDDLPILLRVAGQAGLVEHPALPRPPKPPPLPADFSVPGADQCEGWRSDGTLVARIIDSGGALTMELGDAVPAESDIWPEAEPLPAMATRRRRRVVLHRASPQANAQATIFFRDSYADPDGVERGLHSYRVRAEIDQDAVIGAIDATGLILPWPECWAAAGNAATLRGVPIGDIEARSKTQLFGRGTCTHLTDTLRSLRQVAAFAGLGAIVGA